MDSLKYREQIIVYIANQFSLPEEQVRLMLPEFLNTLSVHMNRLEVSLQENNIKNLSKAGHTIKGALLNLGLVDCADLALEIEQGGSNGTDSIDYPELVARLRGIIDDIIND